MQAISRLSETLLILALCLSASLRAQEISQNPDSIKEALRLYPDMAVLESPFCQKYWGVYDQAKLANDPIFQDPSWPLLLCNRAFDSKPMFVVATQEKNGFKLSSGADWTLEVGEVFPLLRWTSAPSYRGADPDSVTKSYAVVQMDRDTMVIPASLISVVGEGDEHSAAMAYRDLVQRSRDFNQQQRASAAADASATLETAAALQALQLQQMQQMAAQFEAMRNLRRGSQSKNEGLTQRNGQPLPPNWIDPDKADELFRQRKMEREIDRLRSEVNSLR